MTEDKYKNIISSILLTIIGVFIILYMKTLTSNNMFWNDDYGYCAYQMDEGIFSSLRFSQEHGGGYIGLFLCKFLSFGLPNLLGIHPADFIGHIHGIIIGVFSILVIISMTKFFDFYNKSKTTKVLLFSLITLYFFSQAYSSWIFNVNYNFYRYFFSILFFSIFWNNLFKNILKNDDKINHTELILTCICGYIIGSSIEIEIFASTLLSILIIGYNYLSKLFKENIFNLDKKFYIPVICLFTSAILFTTSNGFKEVASIRGMSNIHFNLAEFNEFCKLFIEICVTNEIYYWISFVLLMSASFYFANKKNETKKMILPLLMQLSFLVVMFSLYLCGKTYRGMSDGDFFLKHNNIIFLYQMLLILPLLTYFGYVLKNLNTKIINITVTITLIIGILYYGTANVQKFNNYKQHKQKDLIELRKITYQMEKILRFYYLKDMIPYLPTYVRSIPNQGYAFSYFNVHNKPNCFNDQTTISYYPRIYKSFKSAQLGYYFCDNAMEKFYELGGTFTDEELNNIQFKRLLDEDFILNL